MFFNMLATFAEFEGDLIRLNIQFYYAGLDVKCDISHASCIFYELIQATKP